MDDSKNTEKRTRQIIANAERLIAEVDDALARADRLFADHQLNRSDLVAFMEKNPDAAKMMEQVQKNIAEMAKDMEQKSQRAAAAMALPEAVEIKRKTRRRHDMI